MFQGDEEDDNELIIKNTRRTVDFQSNNSQKTEFRRGRKSRTKSARMSKKVIFTVTN